MCEVYEVYVHVCGCCVCVHVRCIRDVLGMCVHPYLEHSYKTDDVPAGTLTM